MRLSSLVIAAVLLAGACAPANDEELEESLEAAYNEGYEAGLEEAEAEAEEEISELQEALDEASERMAQLIDEQTDAPDEDTDPEDADIIARVDQVYEPAESEARINEANQFNDPPRDGHRFWMLLVTVENRADEPIHPTFDLTWYAEGPEAVIYNEGCGVLPDPNLSDVAAISPGGTQSGHVCFEMRSADAEATGGRSVYFDSYNYTTSIVDD